MEFNERFRYNIGRIFYTYEGPIYPAALNNEITLDRNNIFCRSIIVDIDSNEIEIPIIARSHFKSAITTASPVMPYNRIILPLYTNISSQVRKTFDSIITQLFTRVDCMSRLQKITTGKGDVYYGGKGIIFDADYTPLLLCTISAKRIGINDSTMIYQRPICHVSPKVFAEPDKMVNKGIIKKLIPFFSNMEVILPDNFSSTGQNSEDTVRVVVDNFDNFFIKPVKPTPSTCSNDLLNQCLIDNIDDIMTLV